LTDNTGEITRGFKDKRIKYIKEYKKNKGSSVARNIGRIKGNFKNKFGDYINGGTFIDLFYFQDNTRQC